MKVNLLKKTGDSLWCIFSNDTDFCKKKLIDENALSLTFCQTYCIASCSYHCKPPKTVQVRLEPLLVLGSKLIAKSCAAVITTLSLHISVTQCNIILQTKKKIKESNTETYST